MEKELSKILRQYPDYHVTGMMYEEHNTSWGWLVNIHVDHSTKRIELTFGYKF